MLFEMLEYPQKGEILYLGICYCDLLRKMGMEIPLGELKKCILERFFINPQKYPWGDYLMELEVFFVRERENRFLIGGEIVKVKAENYTVSVDPKHANLLGFICERFKLYRSVLNRNLPFKVPKNGSEVLDNALKLLDAELFYEAAFYLDEYLTYLLTPSELLLYRVFRTLAYLNHLITIGDYDEAYPYADRLLAFLKDFQKELKNFGFDFKGLLRDCSKTLRDLERGKRVKPLKLKVKKGGSFFSKLLGKILGKGRP